MGTQKVNRGWFKDENVQKSVEQENARWIGGKGNFN